MSGHRKQIIPLCRSEFLQDFSIELGRRLKSIRHQSQSVVAEVRFDEHEGRELEALSVWIKTSDHTRATISLWENQTIWLCVELLPTKNNKKFQLDFHRPTKTFPRRELSTRCATQCWFPPVSPTTNRRCQPCVASGGTEVRLIRRAR